MIDRSPFRLSKTKGDKAEIFGYIDFDILIDFWENQTMFVTFYWTSKEGLGSFKGEVESVGIKSRIRTKVDLCETSRGTLHSGVAGLLFELTTRSVCDVILHSLQVRFLIGWPAVRIRLKKRKAKVSPKPETC